MAKRGQPQPTSGLPQIDGYTLQEQIGSGGFSRVYRATQHRLDRHVAVKVLNTSFEDARQQRTFERECKVMGQLSTHPNIVTVYDSAITERGHPCIIMELYQATYRDQGVLDIAQVVGVGAKVADALQAMHDSGIVHRDIKPHNIFISDRGEPALGDFGISSVANERTITGSAGFSVNYAAPEVFEETGTGASGDIYALGATLYHLAAGEVPFPHSGDPSDRLRSTVHRIIASPAPSLHRPDAPDALDRLLRRCMAKTPDERPSNASDVAVELRQIHAQLTVGTQPTSPTVAVQVPPTPPAQNWAAPSPAEPHETSQTDNITFARQRDDRTQLRADLDLDENERSATADSRRRVLIGAAAVLLLIAVSIGVLALTGGSDDNTGPTTKPDPTTTAIPAQTRLVSPTNVEAVDNGDGTYTVTWETEHAGDDVSFFIVAEDMGESMTFDRSPAQYTIDFGDVTPCFRVSVQNAISRSAASQQGCAT